MGKKTKVGKQRQDKYYYLAKETGYRSRAAFKLIQLNKRFEFLQRSRALVDLCAAPGGWLQVAVQNMPVSSICIGVDLVPIRPINNCITMQGDITTEKVRQLVRKELRGWEADCVLHDGAPNIAGNWIQDAFQQNCLTLSALKLATQILKKNGVFVTKVFRSSDYQNLVNVFEQLFKQVHVWKPAASRSESAEIFVVCEKYSKPVKVDPGLLDVKKVFAETQLQASVSNPQLMLQPKRKEKKTPAVGYDSQSLTTYKEINATHFIQSTDYLNLLSEASKIILDEKSLEEDETTTEEIKECLNDIKVCGPRELRAILQWRKKMIKKLDDEAGEKDGASTAENELKKIDPEEERIAEINRQIANARAEEKAALKKMKKKILKEKADLAKRKQLKMVIDGDKYEIPEELELFSLKKIAKVKNSVTDESSEKGEGDDMDDNSDDGDDENPNEIMDNMADESYCEGDHGSSESEKINSRKTDWFKRSGIADFMEDEDEALRAVENFIIKNKDSTGTEKERAGSEVDIREASSTDGDTHEKASAFKNDDDGESDEEYVDADKPNSKRSAKLDKEENQQPLKKQYLSPELLALGEKMIYSSKSRRDLEDWAWNRYTNNDEGLPDWFVEDEKKHYRNELPVDKDRVEFYKNRLREINARSIKKVAEAKARKRRRREMKLRQMRKRAEGILDSENKEHEEKLREVRRLYRKTSLKEKKKVTYMVMTKGKRGAAARPKGPYKVVDARMKKDNRAKNQAGKADSNKRTSKQGRRDRRKTTK